MSEKCKHEISKGAKRKQQRIRAKERQAKQNSVESYASSNSRFCNNNPLDILRMQMDKAKAEKDHTTVNILRQNIWLLQDAAAGVDSKVSAEQLEHIVNATTNVVVSKEPSPKLERICKEIPTLRESHTQVLEKKLHKLQKKKIDIQNLKTRLKAGEKLEKTQLQKIEREKLLDDELQEINRELNELNSTTQ
ncbi:uncharacterized protein LOC143445112 [Clavelina lepadiformis]|uniref:uncharacterized protein LOC143445112 n=1 Tax=Clavelina lepadiformis TaxID=159417 RepID=UPI0040410B2E